MSCKKMKKLNHNYDAENYSEKQLYRRAKDEKRRNIRQARWVKNAIRNQY